MKFIFKDLGFNLSISESENGDILIMGNRILENRITTELDINQQKRLLKYLQKKLKGV